MFSPSKTLYLIFFELSLFTDKSYIFLKLKRKKKGGESYCKVNILKRSILKEMKNANIYYFHFYNFLLLVYNRETGKL